MKVEDDLECNRPVNLVDSAMHTFVFECDKKEGDAGMRKQNKKYNYKIISIKNKIMSFSVQELKDLVREYNELEDQYKAVQNELVLRVLEIASTYYPLLETVSALVSQLDVLCAFALVSSTHQYVRPAICPEEKSKIYLIESKHPLIHLQDPASCINNDCRMVKDASNLQIITGPNMGGKSTYIRQVAICVLLAHIGSYHETYTFRLLRSLRKGRDPNPRLHNSEGRSVRPPAERNFDVHGRDAGGLVHAEGMA